MFRTPSPNSRKHCHQSCRCRQRCLPDPCSVHSGGRSCQQRFGPGRSSRLERRQPRPFSLAWGHGGWIVATLNPLPEPPKDPQEWQLATSLCCSYMTEEHSAGDRSRSQGDMTSAFELYSRTMANLTPRCANGQHPTIDKVEARSGRRRSQVWPAPRPDQYCSTACTFLPVYA